MRSISANFGPSGIFSGGGLGPGWVLGCLGSPNILSYMGDGGQRASDVDIVVDGNGDFVVDGNSDGGQVKLMIHGLQFKTWLKCCRWFDSNGWIEYAITNDSPSPSASLLHDMRK